MIARNRLFATRGTLGLLTGVILALSGAAAGSANTFSGNIFTVAGGARGAATFDAQPATKVRGRPNSVAALPDGGFLIADPAFQHIYRAAPDGTIKIVAGRVTNCDHRGNFGDSGPATEAQLNHPKGVAAHPDGGFLIADSGNSLIRRVWPDGTITRVAGAVNARGESKSGSRGDGGQATQARLKFPTAVAVLPDGGFLIADSYNSLIRRVWPNGIITTVAGSVDRDGDGIEGYSGDGRPATEARLRQPEGIAVLPDGGFLIADSGNNAIRRVDRGGTISLVAGSQGNLFGGPSAGHDGDGGPATSALLHHPAGIAVLPDGGFLIADQLNRVIRRVAPGPMGAITHFAGVIPSGYDRNRWRNNGDPATTSPIGQPTGVAVSTDGRVLIADAGGDGSQGRVSLVDSDVRGRPSAQRNPLNPHAALAFSQIATWAGDGTPGYTGDTLFASQAQLSHPQGVAVMPERKLKLANLPANHDMTEQGSVFIADTGNHRIRKLTPDGKIWTVAGTGEDGFMIRKADGSWTSLDGKTWTIAGTGEDGGSWTSPEGQPATSTPLNYPTDVDALSDGSFFIADRDNNLIRRVDGNGTIHTVAGEPVYTKRRGGRFFGTGALGYNGDRRPALGARLNHPHGVTAFADGRVLIADSGNHIIRAIDSKGDVSTVAGTPEDPSVLFGPERVLRLRSGALLIANTQAHNIVRKDPHTGLLERVAGIPKNKGVGEPTFKGENGTPADCARLSAPVGLLERDTNLGGGGFLFADSFNARIRQVSMRKTSRRTVRFPAIFNLIGTGNNAFGGDFGLALHAGLDRPNDLDRHPEGLIIADTNNNVVRFVLGSAGDR